MRYSASEKLEIIRLVERSHLSARQTLALLGIPRTTFYRWYDRYLLRGEAGLQDQSPKPKHVWNRIPDDVRRKVVKLALKETELSPRELAVTFTMHRISWWFLRKATVYFARDAKFTVNGGKIPHNGHWCNLQRMATPRPSCRNQAVALYARGHGHERLQA